MTEARKRQKIRPIGVVRRTRSALMVSTALQAVVVTVLAVPAAAQPAVNAQPTGGVVVGGSAAISHSANNTTINQTSQRAALNWQSFDVGSQQSVTFQQPNARAIALNTVTGPNPSQIAGRIDANGQIVLVNQSGVTFYKGSQVNTAGLMVSAASADPQAFMRGGNIAFDKAGHPDARIINNGNITISGAGLASLVAPSVANAGTITARLGTVVLAGAKTATLDLYGDKLVTLNVTGAVTKAPDGGQALVTNTGVIRADGGTVRLTARAVDGVVTNLVTAGGKIQARTIGSHKGDIAIDAVGGSITITGDLDATGRAEGTTGGRVGLLASDAVIVKSGAVVNASGKAGGGTIAIGTTLQRAAGGPAVTGARMAKGVLIQQGATIAANATGKGEGGRVTVLSSRLTTMDGTIAVKGGPSGGNGGFVEVSGGTLALTGVVDRSAPSGLAGTLLLDPTDLAIVDGVVKSTNIDGEFNGGTLGFLAADAGKLPSSISAGEINTLGAAGNVVIQASGTIEFQNTNTAISIANDLTAQAGADLLIDRGVGITTTGTLSLTSGADLTTGIATNAGAITLGAGKSPPGPVTLSAGALVLNAGSTGISLNDSAITVTGSAGLNALGGGVAQSASGILNAGTVGGSLTGSVSLPGTANVIASLGSIAVSKGDLAVVTTGDLAVTGPVLAGNVTLNNATGGTIAISGSIVATTSLALAAGSGGIRLNSGNVLSGATVDVSTTGGGVTQVATGTLTATSVLQSSSNVVGGVTLAGTNNAIASLGNFAVTGGSNGFALANGSALAVAGTLTTPGNIYLQSSQAGGISVTGSVGAGGIAGFQTDAFSITGAVTGGTFELAPNTTGAAIALGSGGYLASLSGIGPANVRLGAVTVPGSGLVTTAGSVAIATSFGDTKTNLELDSNGAVSQSAGAVLSAKTLTGSAASLSLPQVTNSIGTLGAFSSSNGFALTNGQALLVNGPVSVSGPGTLALSTTIGDLTLAGDVSAGGVVDLVSAAAISQTGGSISASSLTGSAATSASLARSTNQVGALAAFSTAAGLALTDNRALTVNGAVSDTGAASTLAPTTKAGGITLAGNVSATNALDLTAAGAISQSGGSISAAVLTGTATAVSLTQTSNAIGTLGAFTTTAGFALTDSTALLVNGPVTDTGNAAALALRTTSGGLTLAGNISAADAIDLVSAGTIGQASGSITAITLTGSAAASASLNQVTNLVGTLGAFTTSLGFLLTDGQSLLVSGAVTDSGAASTLALTTTGGLTLANNVNATNVLDLVAAGTISQTGGSIGAFVLTGSSGNSAILAGASAAANQVANLGVFTATAGTLALSSGEAFHVTGSVAAPAGDVVLRAMGFGRSIAVQPGVALAASSSGTVSVRADAFSNAGTVTGGVFEYASDSAGALKIGTGGDALVDLTGIGSSLVRLGQARGTITANSIMFDADLDLSVGHGNVARALDLQSDGSISGGGNGLRNVTTLIGVANAGSVVLTGGTDSIAAIGAFTAGGGFTLTNSGALALSGVLAAAQVQLTATNITIDSPGSINTGGSAAGAVSLVATAGTISGTGRIGTGTLSGGAVTAINLSGPNQIGSLGSLNAGSISLNDNVALTIANTVSASGAVSLNSGGLLRVSAGQSVTGSGVTLTGTGLTIAGLVSTSGTVDLQGGTGSIAEPGTIVAAAVTGAANGSLMLSGTSANTNRIGSLLALSSTTGSIVVNDGASLSVSGPVSVAAGDIVLRSAGTGQQINLTATGTLAAGGTVSVRSDQFVNSAGGTITGGTFEFAPDTPENLTIGTGATLASLAGIGTGVVRIGAAEGTTTANGLTLAANLDLGVGHGGIARALDLQSNDSIDSGGFALLNVTTLTGVANTGSVSFSNVADTVDTLGSFTVGTGFTFADAVPLTIANVLAAAPVSLTAPNITISGTIHTGGSAVSSTTLVANTGTISETGAGAIITGTLLGSATGAATLSGANRIGTITGFTAPSLTLVDNGGLTLAGLVSVGPSGTLDISKANVTQAAGGTIVAGILTSSGGVGTALLQGTANQIGTIGNFMATGSLEVIDGTALTIAGSVGASAGNAFVTTGTQTVSFAPGAWLVSQSGGTIGILADGLTNLGTAGATGVLNAGSTGVFEFAPSTASRSVTLGAASGPSLATTTGITAGTIRIGAVTLPGGVAPTVNTASIVVAGTFNANGDALELDAVGSVTQSAPLLNVAALTGSAASFSLGNAGNTIAQLGGGSLTAQSGMLTVVDNSNLTIAGTVQASVGSMFVGLASGDTLSFAPAGGTLQTNGTTIGIQADQVVNLGTNGATGVVNAGTGGVFELAPSTALATATLGASAGLSLTNLTGITAATLRVGAVTLPGSAAPSVTAGSIAVAGTFDAVSIATLDLEAKGPVSQSAPIQVLSNLIVSTNGVAGDIALGDTLNSIGTISNISVAAGNFSFGDTPVSGSFAVPAGQTITANNVAMTIIGTLDVTGSLGATAPAGNVLLAALNGASDLNLGSGARVTAGTTGTASLTAARNLSQTGGIINGGSVSLAAGGLLTVGANVSAAAASLTGANIMISGIVTNGGSGPVSLNATAGSIVETGTLITGTLSGSSAGATTLTSASNQVGTLTNFSAAGFALNDTTDLTVTGTVNGGASATVIDDQALTVSGGVSAAAIALQGTSITIPGVVTAGVTGSVQLIATNGTISGTGALIAGTLSGSSTGATSLTGATATANQVAAIGNFTAAGFTLNDGVPLSVTGVLNGGPFVTIFDSGLISVVGGIEAASISLTGASIDIPGLLTDGGSGTVSLVASGGTISETGELIAGTLSGSSTGATTLSGAFATANQVATLTQFSAGIFMLNDGEGLTITGAVAAGGSFALTDTGNLTITGAASISAGGISISDTGSATIAGVVTSSSALAMTTSGVLTMSGLVSGQSGVTIDNNGAMTITGSVISPAGAVGITERGPLNIAGLVSGQSGVSIAETGAMTISGSVISAGGTAGILDNGALTVVGTVFGQSGLSLVATGDMTLSGQSGSSAGTVSITDAGVLSLNSTSSVTSPGTLTITDRNAINLGGQLSAPKIVIDNGAGTLNILPGTAVQTSGVTRPQGVLTQAQLPVSATSSSGFFITTGQLVQTGVLTVAGAPSTMRIDASTGVSFAPSPSGLQAPNTWLILGLSNGAKATGGVNVLALDTVFTGLGSGAQLSGSVGGLGGNAAAGAARISPGSNSTFRINGCPISSVNCVLLTTQGIPTASPLNSFVIGSLFDPNDQDDLLLPLVSDAVY